MYGSSFYHASGNTADYKTLEIISNRFILYTSVNIFTGIRLYILHETKIFY
ncbi:hypothetical protein TREAZ_2075 [Leadbettera azotonutricia ZAS-9]|uniref:Uncharacterized protein n=1 Tax=Leadbettera azotonutricia (strain ATCC BAA-888 / DSM 13862 / ZAS-9) TaxID=545695 RepID=F5Y9Y8_LEAAZ|nr:hypothetical protein TREAZ_2075 [Leadbettera azotonutricia ZAS-9]